MPRSKKILKVMKAQYGGGADAGGKKSPGKGTHKSTKKAYEPPPGEKGGPGYVKTKKNNLGTRIKNKAVAVGSKAKTIGMQALPFTPFGFAIKGLEAVENARRAKRAKGEFYTSKKKELPITRDFYKTTGRPLDTKVGSKDEPYMKAAGIIGFPKNNNMMDAGPKTPLCPDGTMPPCPPVATTPVTPQQSQFLGNFKAYNSGGVSKGPPPLRGPNPQVPPVKMRNGKLTKSYKMSCPHRPDGIRGVGASLRGHKFIGVK